MASSVPDLVLGSSSPSRKRLLENAGLAFEVVPPRVDEASILQVMRMDDDTPVPSDVAEVLARAKAEEVRSRVSGRAVLCSDQVLSLGDGILTKPASMEAARDQLLKLAGKTHQLHTAAVLVKGDMDLWSMVTTVDVTFRPYDPAFVGRYLAACGETVLSSVGAYQIEGVGVQLISKLVGDIFSVQGLPLIETLEALREHKVIGG
ncbi:MAG: Maf family nucleotide pyrophosphatase [Pseudomonadota bacterium]